MDWDRKRYAGFLSHQLNHAAANVRPFQLRNVTDPLAGIKQEREGKSLPRARGPVSFVCNDFRIGPSVTRTKAITINADYGIVVAKANLGGERHKSLEHRNGQVGHAGSEGADGLDNYPSLVGLKVSDEAVAMVVNKVTQ